MCFYFTKVISYKTIPEIANMERYGMKGRHHFHKPNTHITDFWFSNFVFLYFKAPAVFWWENFGSKVNRLTVVVQINTTPGIAF